MQFITFFCVWMETRVACKDINIYVKFHYSQRRQQKGIKAQNKHLISCKNAMEKTLQSICRNALATSSVSEPFSFRLSVHENGVILWFVTNCERHTDACSNISMLFRFEVACTGQQQYIPIPFEFIIQFVIFRFALNVCARTPSPMQLKLNETIPCYNLY